VRPALTRDAERLIERHVDSVGMLDLLLLLRSRPARAWTTAELCQELRCPREWALAELRRLRDAGFATWDGDRHRYAPASPAARAAADDLAGAWRRDRAAVTRLIFAQRRIPFDG
jgi:DNA-binding IclR family transcriptional regulator